MQRKAKLNIRQFETPWVEGQRQLADIVMHERRDEPRPGETWDSDKVYGPVLDPTSAYPPAVLSHLIHYLLPEPLGKRPEIKEVRWNNTPDPTSAEKFMSISTYPAGLKGYAPELDGLTVVQAETSKSINGSPIWVKYQFPTITEDDQFPEVTERHGFTDGYGQRTSCGWRRDYIDAAPGIGAVVSALLIQANKILVLEQEIKDFVRS